MGTILNLAKSLRRAFLLQDSFLKPNSSFILYGAFSRHASSASSSSPDFKSTSGTSSTSSAALIQYSLKKYVRWYPGDDVTGSNIENFFSVTHNASRCQNLLVGIVYENEQIQKKSNMLQVLLAEPLSSGSQRWFEQLENRCRYLNNLVSHPSCEDSQLHLLESFRRSIHEYKVSSSFLCGEARPKFPQVLPPQVGVPNNVLFLEINKPDEVLKLIEICHFYIYVAADLSGSKESLPKQIQKKILLTVVDNCGFTPRTTEATHVPLRPEESQLFIKINSEALKHGIQYFYSHDVKGGGRYFDSIQESNILEVRKYLSWFLRTDNLRKWLLALIKTEIASNTVSEARVRDIYADLKLHSLLQCSNAMHEELQSEFIPRTNDYFRKKLSWWKLYLINDNVEYILKDYLSANFMPKSIDSYNYMKGQLVARLQEQKFAHYSDSDKTHLDNPLQDFKTNLVIERIPPEVQLAVYAAIFTGFAYYQLPFSAASLVGYLFFNLQSQMAAALALLGWILGFNKVSKDWLSFTSGWLYNLYEEVRLVLSKGCVDQGLMKELNVRYEAARDLARVKQQVLNELEATDKQEKE